MGLRTVTITQVGVKPSDIRIAVDGKDISAVTQELDFKARLHDAPSIVVRGVAYLAFHGEADLWWEMKVRQGQHTYSRHGRTRGDALRAMAEYFDDLDILEDPSLLLEKP